MGSSNSIDNTNQVSKQTAPVTDNTAGNVQNTTSTDNSQPHKSKLKSSLKKTIQNSDTQTVTQPSTGMSRKLNVSIRPGTESPTPSKRPPMRTISKIIRDADDQLYNRFPEMKDTLNGITTLGPWLSSLIEDGEEPEEPDCKDVGQQLKTKVLDKFDMFNESDQRKLMGNHMAKHGFVKDLGDFYKFLLKALPLPEYTLAEADDKDDGIAVVEQMRHIFWNLSDNSVEFCNEIVENTGMIRLLVIDLLAMKERELNLIKEDSFPFVSAVGILHNVARSGVTKSFFSVVLDEKETNENAHPTNVWDVLMPFLKTKNMHIKLITLLCLAHIVNEQQNKDLSGNASLFDFLLEMMKAAIKNKDRRQYGFSVEELLDGLANLAKNDSNKAIIMDKKAFPILRDIIMKGKSEGEKAEALKVIWELAFMGKNKQIFMGDKDFWKKLYSLQSEEDHEGVARAAQGACFVITDGDLQSKAPSGVKSFRKPAPAVPKEEKKEEDQHIMISYNWADQKKLLKVRDSLQEVGYKVWMDVDNMEGDILDAMARAVENAQIVLICYSEKYKESKNCRTEAQYAYQVNKEIVPILMQTKYKPEGWLGILVGSKLFFEFTNKYPFESKIRDLIRELENRFRVSFRRDSTPKLHSLVSAKLQQVKQTNLADKKSMLTWTKDDLSEWLTRNKLEALAGMQLLNGELLTFLYKLFRRAPEFFYRCLEKRLGLKSLEDLMRFTDALEKLSDEQPEINQLLL
ncbi:uncharacterized protein LOC110445638 [Mizuhopecten yessoensis]|uniref:TIR domain-containing protein n=1 Tax=Mizuhopecten yessoensis TaxID=6573 RepID=A0A210QZ72_MIZYE|nr:uncharacterized protein LOC110445638 [Mizuhopecten yessoensis]XP_021346026.1 uncharacterized protein LOC110445638 [Mizuhopecten yessoensis]OWF54050.1 hypothetical protein KP79_PYT15269 [Mizuhopecten yessoensis]